MKTVPFLQPSLKFHAIALLACTLGSSIGAAAEELPAAPAPRLQLPAGVTTLAVAQNAQAPSAPMSPSSGSAATPAQAPAITATPAPALKIVILEGEDVSNNIKERTAREPIVQVEDENHKPVAGAAVLFSIDSQGGNAGATFLNGAKTFVGQTDANGQVQAQGFHPNGHTGQFHVNVTATKGNLSTRATISQTNVALATAAATTAGITGFIATHVVLVSIVAGAIVAGGVTAGVVASHSGSATTITTGTGTVGAPQARPGLRFSFRK